MLLKQAASVAVPPAATARENTPVMTSLTPTLLKKLFLPKGSGKLVICSRSKTVKPSQEVDAHVPQAGLVHHRHPGSVGRLSEVRLYVGHSAEIHVVPVLGL